MADVHGGEIDLLGLSIEKATRIEQAIGHLAKVIELGLVDVALDPSIANNGSREQYLQLGQKLAEISGITYELVADIASATGISIESGEEDQRAITARSQPTHFIEPASLPNGAPKQTAHTEAPQPREITRPTTPQPSVTPVIPPSPLRQSETTHPPGGTGTENTRQGSENLSEGAKLYERIIDPSDLPEMRPVDESEAISIVIWGDNVLKIKQQKIKLNEQELFLFNALLMLRDEPRSASAIRSLGFVTTGKSAPSMVFYNNVNSLMKKINTPAGKEIIKKLGERSDARYAVNPRMVLTDFRDTMGHDPSATVDAGTKSVKKN